jgi:mRNA-degrading endonuclease RelE of RelBE toxin-antitoxin system
MRVFLTSQAHKQYEKLKSSDREKIRRKLHLLATSPFEGKRLCGQLAGCLSMKAWPYRIIYIIKQREKEVWIVSILHRQGAYK